MGLFIVASRAEVLIEVMSGDLLVFVVWWSVHYSIVGLRVFLMIYNLDVGLLESFLTTATLPSSPNILNNISSLLPFVLKMSQQQVGSLVLTIVFDDLMSILYRIPFVSINPLMVWWEISQSCLRLVSR